MSKNGKFEPTMYVTAYELARDGLNNTQIAKTLGVIGETFHTWCQKRPALVDALARGRHYRDPGDEFTFHEYIFDHLSPHLQELWKEIGEYDTLENGVERIEALLAHHGIRARQQLFVYSLVQTCFNVSKSLRKLAIPMRTYQNWCANDPDFAELIDEINWHKENFFEQAFMGRVAAGDTSAILHAVRTQLRSRGYNEKIEIEHTGTIQHEHSINLVELDLDIEVRRTVLAALRTHQAAIEVTGVVQALPAGVT